MATEVGTEKDPCDARVKSKCCSQARRPKSVTTEYYRSNTAECGASAVLPDFHGVARHVRFASGMGWAYAKKRHDWESGFESVRESARGRRQTASNALRVATATEAAGFCDAASSTTASVAQCAARGRRRRANSRRSTRTTTTAEAEPPTCAQRRSRAGLGQFAAAATSDPDPQAAKLAAQRAARPTRQRRSDGRRVARRPRTGQRS